MSSGEVIGAEALVRWNHPHQGIIPPVGFLPLIDNHVLGLKLGKWIINRALTQMETWLALDLTLPISVNISGHQLQQSDFASQLQQLLAAHPSVDPKNLELEVVESSALDDIDHVSGVIRECNRLGPSFTLDDFGTGYSSLTYLKRLPTECIKIDQTFVRDMLDDPDDLAILEGVTSMARAFRLLPIAEGVETREHGEMLLQLDCRYGQGYGIARPMPAEKLPEWINNWQPFPEWRAQRPIKPVDLPLLQASAEHRAWIRGIRDCVRKERLTPPPLNTHRCRFGRWLDSDGSERYGDQPTFQSIIPLHEAIHLHAEKMCDERTPKTPEEIQEMLDELIVQRDKLLNLLKTLIQESQHRA
jgi:EAL domain-containing protein (putative c-di-GMP-specific phosphodiesterase class I)